MDPLLKHVTYKAFNGCLETWVDGRSQQPVTLLQQTETAPRNDRGTSQAFPDDRVGPSICVCFGGHNMLLVYPGLVLVHSAMDTVTEWLR